MSTTQRHPGTGSAGAEDMLKDFWATRPVRPRRGRKIAGVAAGIAARYRIDPTLVRVGFVVAAIYGGVGLLLYLVGWLTLPEQDDEASPLESLIGKGRSSTSKFFTLVLCAAVIPVASWVFSGFFPGWMGLIIAVGLLYLLHRGRGGIQPLRPAAESPFAAPMAAPMTPPMPQPVTDVLPTMPAASTQLFPDLVQAQTPPAPRQEPPAPEPEPEPAGPPAWDPLGAAPFAWDLPEPTPVHTEPEPPPARRPKSKIGLMTVAAALIAGSGVLILGDMWGGFDERTAVGVSLGVIGLGMVIGAFLRGGRGLIGLAVPLAVIGIGLTTFTTGGWNGVGDVAANPLSSARVADDYVRSVGNITLNLTGIPATDLDIHSRIQTDVGNVLVIVPADADVELECQTQTGDLDCLGQKLNQYEAEIPEFLDEGTDGPGGLQIDLDVEVGTAGNVEVRRG